MKVRVLTARGETLFLACSPFSRGESDRQVGSTWYGISRHASRPGAPRPALGPSVPALRLSRALLPGSFSCSLIVAFQQARGQAPCGNCIPALAGMTFGGVQRRLGVARFRPGRIIERPCAFRGKTCFGRHRPGKLYERVFGTVRREGDSWARWDLEVVGCAIAAFFPYRQSGSRSPERGPLWRAR